MIVHIGKDGGDSWAEPATGDKADKATSEVAGSLDMSECSCCLACFGLQDVVARLPCSHVFHEECIIDWSATATKAAVNCPLCRHNFAR